MATPAPFVAPFYLSDAGAPLAAGLLYTYDAGTSTPKTTYSDPAGTTPNANPIVLDAAGRAAIYLGEGSYKFILKDAQGNTLWSRDNIQDASLNGALQVVGTVAALKALAAGISSYAVVLGYYSAGDIDLGVFRWDGASSAADDGGITIAPTVPPVSGRWIRVYSGEVNAKWFGAKGDTVTDDTAKLAAANTYIQSLANGGTLFFPASSGSYLYTTNPAFGAKVELHMQTGAMFTSAAVAFTCNGKFRGDGGQHFSATVGAITFAKNAVRFFLPEWLGAKGDAATDDTAALNASFAVIGAHLEMKAGATYIISDTINFTIAGKRVFGYGAVLKRKDGSIPGTWTTGEAAMMRSAVNLVELYGLEVDGNKANNISINQGDGFRIDGGSGCVVEGCYFHDVARDSIVCGYGANDNLIVNNRIYMIGLVGMNGGNGVAVTNGSRNIIQGNNIKGDAALASAVTSCIDIEPNTAEDLCENNVIIGNTCDFVRIDQGIANYNPDVCRLIMQASGYTNCIAGDIGKTVTAGSVTGTLLNYDNTTREWNVRIAGCFIPGTAATITTGTGAGTIDLYKGYRAIVNGTVIQGNTLYSSDTTKAGLYAMRLRGCSNVKVIGNTIRHGSDYNVQADGSLMGLIFQGNNVMDGGGIGFSALNLGYECQILGNVVRGHVGDAMVFNGGDHLTIKGNKISFSGGIGLTTSGNTFVEIEGNNVHDCQQDGIKAFACSNIIICNNRSVDNGRATNNTYDSIVLSGTHDFVRVFGNTVGSQAATVNKVRYGINDSSAAVTGGSTRLDFNDYLYTATAATNLATGFTIQWMDEAYLSQQLITHQAGGYVSCVIGDLGKTVVGGTSGATGILKRYDNTLRQWVIQFPLAATMTVFQAAEAVTITSGTGAGTTNAVSLNNSATILDLKSKFTWSHGTTAPEGFVNARPGSWYIQTSGASGLVWWMKDTSTGTTGWTQVARVEKNIFFRSAIPSSGAWTLGDLIINSGPSDGEATGWICTVTGDFATHTPDPTFRTIGAWINSQWGEDLQMQNGFNLDFGTGTGTKIGSTAAKKFAFWGSTPIVQPSSTGETVGFTAGAGTNVTDASTFTGNVGTKAYRISDIVKHLKNTGLIAAS